jgi:hypothetical protein
LFDHLSEHYAAMVGSFSLQEESFTVKFLKHYKTHLNKIREQTLQVFGNKTLGKIYEPKSMEK